MKVGILGTRGIPNQYGGFEQFAEYFSIRLAQRGVEVWVYNSHNHPYRQSEWKGVHIIHCFDPEFLVGPAGPFIYDLNCILDSRRRNFDVILQLGYASSSVWYRFLPGGPLVITNMDGLEWSRSKYNRGVKAFIRYAESIAVKKSHRLIADSMHILDYLRSHYSASCDFIPYGAEILQVPDQKVPEMYGLNPFSYFLAISRIQSDNNTEAIIRGFLESGTDLPLLLIGSVNHKYAQHLKQFYNATNIRFMGSIFDIGLLNQLRHFARLYFHGHSSGGTNPSLLEAMASQALICAHDNRFNRNILGFDGYYFENEHDIAQLIKSDPRKATNDTFLRNNLKKIEENYQWDRVTDAYLEVFNRFRKT